MHQVLSYETAVRANNVSEYREYVTKRTCISLVVTIAFFTLISGEYVNIVNNFFCFSQFHKFRKQHKKTSYPGQINDSLSNLSIYIFYVIR